MTLREKINYMFKNFWRSVAWLFIGVCAWVGVNELAKYVWYWVSDVQMPDVARVIFWAALGLCVCVVVQKREK